VLRATGQLSPCEVPLALVHLRDNGAVDFVDTWPVRRSLTRPALSRRWWPFGGTDARRRAEAEAAMSCFQEHVSAIPANPNLRNAMAREHFAFLPGGGFLPVGVDRFDAKTFLGATAVEVTGADIGRLRTLVEESWACDAIDLNSAPPPISYFTFVEAGGQWVFFLRRRTEIPEPVEDDLESPPIAGSEGPEDPDPEEPAVPDGVIVVVVAKTWITKNGNPAKVQYGKLTANLLMTEIPATHVDAAINKWWALTGPGGSPATSGTSFPGLPGPGGAPAGSGMTIPGLPGPGGVPGGSSIPKLRLADMYKGARFFIAEDVRAGSYRVAVKSSSTFLKPATTYKTSGAVDPGRAWVVPVL
jgi:hypothetical protein